MPKNIIRQTGGSVNVGDGYLYDYITRDAGGNLRFWSQDCVVNDDGEVEAVTDPLDMTDTVDRETLAAWADDWTLDSRHGDPADCLTPAGETLVGHRLTRQEG